MFRKGLGTVLMDAGKSRRAPCSGQGTMRTIAERQGLAVFAAAPGHLLLRRDPRLQRTQTRALVRSIAKRLGLGPAAGAEPVCARRGLLNQGGLLKNVRFAHGRRLCANPCLRATRETAEASAWTRTSPLWDARCPGRHAARQGSKTGVTILPSTPAKPGARHQLRVAGATKGCTRSSAPGARATRKCNTPGRGISVCLPVRLWHSLNRLIVCAYVETEDCRLLETDLWLEQRRACRASQVRPSLRGS